MPWRSAPTMKRTRGAAGQAVALDVPPCAAQHLVARRGHADGLRRGRARREADLALGREAEEVEQPLARELLDAGHARRDRVQGGVLVPRRHEPVGGERDGLRAADHPAVEPGRSDRDEPGLRALREARDHLGRRLAVLGQLSAERVDDGLDVDARRDRDAPARESSHSRAYRSARSSTSS